MEVKSTLACGLQKSIGNLWKGDDFSDFTVVVEDTTFKCHRFILSACSSFFQGLFRSNLKECQENKATIGGMTASTFDVILNSVYKGIDGLTEDNVLDIWSATVQLQIGYLAEECENFVIENMTVDSCFIVLSHATMYSANRVIDHSLAFVSDYCKWEYCKNSLLQLPYSCLSRIIEEDYLAASSEDVVLETIFNWIEYTPRMEHSQLSTNYDANSNSQINDSLKETEIFTLSNMEGQSSYDNSEVSHITGREQHLFQLISACRLYVVNPNYLEYLLKNNKLLLSCREAYNLIFEALMYGLNVERRHDAWPDLAVHRMSSSLKHVMVFVYNQKCLLYHLEKGSVHELASLPQDFEANKTITIFDNKLYLDYVDKQGQVLSMYARNESWEWINGSKIKKGHSFMLPHKTSIYGLFGRNLDCIDLHGDLRQWSFCVELRKECDVLIRYKENILAFYTENSVVTAQCYNTETKEIHVGTTSMDGTSKDLTSFSHQGDVFILQRNGSLWKIVSSDTEPVDFELISKLWDQDYNLRGCVVYREQLFVFCVDDQELNAVTFWIPHPEIICSVKMIAVKMDTQCLPIIVPKKLVSLRSLWRF